MKKDVLLKYYENFPSVLKEKLVNGNLSFPENTEFDYKPIKAYRGVVRKEGDNSPLNLLDMKSYSELGKFPKGCSIDMSCPTYFAVSLFENIDMLTRCFDFTNPRKKVAVGDVYKEGGPISKGKNTHISWWLFDDVNLSGFDIKENENE